MRLLTLFSLTLALQASDGQTPALNKISQPLNGPFKVENGLILNWASMESDVTKNQVMVFDSKGSPLVSLKVLGLVPEAKSAGIWGVAASPGQWIAVAPVFSKGPGTGPGSGSILFFDFKGSLISTFALSANWTAKTITADDQGNLWVLTSASENSDPSKVPLIVEYNTSGKVLHTYLTRADFPAHATHFSFSTATGFAKMGFGNGVVWLWMPLPGELVTIDTYSGAVTRLRTGLPESESLQLESSPYYDPVKGTLMVQMVTRKRSSGPESSLFRWTQARPEWLAAPLGPDDECPGVNYGLVGADDAGQAVFASARLQQFCSASAAPE